MAPLLHPRSQMRPITEAQRAPRPWFQALRAKSAHFGLTSPSDLPARNGGHATFPARAAGRSTRRPQSSIPLGERGLRLRRPRRARRLRLPCSGERPAVP